MDTWLSRCRDNPVGVVTALKTVLPLHRTGPGAGGISMEGQVMALRQGSECFTKWTHVEDGRGLDSAIAPDCPANPQRASENDHRRRSAGFDPHFHKPSVRWRGFLPNVTPARIHSRSGSRGEAAATLVCGRLVAAARGTKPLRGTSSIGLECSTRLDHVEKWSASAPASPPDTRCRLVGTAIRVLRQDASSVHRDLYGTGVQGQAHCPNPLVLRIKSQWVQETDSSWRDNSRRVAGVAGCDCMWR